MNIEKKRSGNDLVVSVSGRLDTNTAPELDKALENEFASLQNLVLDFENLEYLSSAGLRVILSCQKIMNKQGSMVIKNANSSIKEIFDITGFSEIVNIE